MIWGMTLEPGKAYTEIIGEEVQLSMAAMESRKDLSDGSSNSFCQIVMKTSKGEYVLCTLIHGVMFQQNLDLKLMPREKVTFSVQGQSVVYLVGYTASYPEDEEFGDAGEEDLEAAEDESAWEAFESDSSQLDNIKEEPVEIIDDEVKVEDVPLPQLEEAPSSHQQAEQPLTEPRDNQQEQEDDVIFSVPDLEADVKVEAPDPKPSPDPTMPQLTHQEDLYGMQTTDDGTALPQTSPNSEYFYPETQQQPSVPVTPPELYQPPSSSGGYPQANPQAALPPPEQFIPPQKTMMQRSQAGPMRHSMGRSGMQPMNTQRNYPGQRRQYGTNRNQPTAKSRSAPQPINVQQMRAVGSVQQQQSMPGPSQQDLPGPSTSGVHTFEATDRRLDQRIPAPPPQDARTHQLRRSVQPSPPNGRFCSYCGKKFETAHKLKVHERFHLQRQRFNCPYCPRTFALMGDFKRHERIHTGEKPFQCSYCPKAFPRVATLRDHEMIHTGLKPFKCSVCFESFRRKQSMKIHERKVHNIIQ